MRWLYLNVGRPLFLIILYGLLGSAAAFIVGNGVWQAILGLVWLLMNVAATKWVLFVLFVGLLIYILTRPKYDDPIEWDEEN